MDVWLRPNRRPLLVMMILPGMILVTGVLVLMGLLAAQTLSLVRVVSGSALVVVGVVWGVRIGIRCVRPRIKFQYDQIKFFIGPQGQAISTPVEMVEGFLLGQTPTHLLLHPGRAVETRNLIARISQRETDWAERDVDSTLGRWCEGYVTIYGTCCERLDLQLLDRINQALVEAKNAQKNST